MMGKIIVILVISLIGSIVADMIVPHVAGSPTMWLYLWGMVVGMLFSLAFNWNRFK